MAQRRPAQLTVVVPAGEATPGEDTDHPVGRPGRGERGEQVVHGGLDLLVGVDRDGAIVVPDEPGG